MSYTEMRYNEQQLDLLERAVKFHLELPASQIGMSTEIRAVYIELLRGLQEVHAELVHDDVSLTRKLYTDTPVHENTLQEADRIINGPRMESYGDPRKSFLDIAKVWSVIAGCEITAKQVTLMMVCLKVLRENSKHHRDNFVDINGYSALGMKVETGDLKA